MHAREAIPYNLGKQAPEDAVNRLATYVSDKGGYRQNSCLERGAKGFGFQFVMCHDVAVVINSTSRLRFIYYNQSNILTHFSFLLAGTLS